MSKSMWEINLAHKLVVAETENDAMEIVAGMHEMSPDYLEAEVKLSHELTIRAFVLAQTMIDTEKFDYEEIRECTGAFLRLHTNLTSHELYSIADKVFEDVERFEGADESVLEWLI